MGLRSFSMHPSQIPAVKQRVLRADAQRLAGALPLLLASEDPRATAEKELAAARSGVAVVQ
jgi:phosphotransferase system enzyme I (PtsI)